ncbi:MAG TPA: sporulation protein YjcZ [Paenibacillaceae bacterium]
MSYPVAGYSYGGGYSKAVAFVLVLFILLVIILKSGILY